MDLTLPPWLAEVLLVLESLLAALGNIGVDAMEAAGWNESLVRRDVRENTPWRGSH